MPTGLSDGDSFFTEVLSSQLCIDLCTIARTYPALRAGEWSQAAFLQLSRDGRPSRGTSVFSASTPSHFLYVRVRCQF